VAYLVTCFVEDRVVRKPRGFSAYSDALGYLMELSEDALADGLRVEGDPCDAIITVFQGDEYETYRIVEENDPRILRKSTTASLQPRVDQNLP